MKTIIVLALALQLSPVALAQTVSPSAAPAAPQIVDVRSGELRLKGYFWKPAGPGPFPAILFNHGSGADDPQHTAGRTMAEAASDLAPVFLKHGYAFFYLCRRGQGLSADQGPFMQDLLKQAEAKGADARKQLHYQLITGSQLDDALAGLTFLKAAPDVDPKRIAIVGHSFGGMLTLLSGDHDSTIRAEVAFAAGANSWQHHNNCATAPSWQSGKRQLLSCLCMRPMTSTRHPERTSLRNSTGSTNPICSKFIPPSARSLMMGTICFTLASPNGNRMFFSFWTITSNSDSIRVRVLRGPE